MKTCLILLGTLLLSLSPLHGQQQQKPRTFTAKSGETVEGIIQTVATGIAQIRMANGRVIPAKVEMLVQEDQKYIEDWFVRNKLVDGNYFDIEVERNKEQLDRTDHIYKEVKRSNASYDVKMRSKSTLDLTDLEVRYIIFMKEDDRYVRHNNNRLAERGKHKIEFWPAQELMEFQTKALKLETEQLAQGWYSYGKARARDQLAGIWLRIYRGDLMLAEFSSPTFLQQRYTWEDAGDEPLDTPY
jgi:hypothetical protein